jgi:hypothetical protein
VRFLAVSQNTGDPRPLIPAETERMKELLARGVVEHAYVKADYSGAVLIVSATDGRQAEQELATLPMVEAHLTSFTVTALADT